MSRITRGEIEKVARLSRLSLTPEKLDQYAVQLDAILEYAAKLDEIDVREVEPTSHALPMTNVFRDDIVVPSLTPERALANAPDSEAQCFKVPQIIQG